MTIRAVVVDIDGTMTDYQRRLQWSGMQAVRKAEERGIPVLCATGNVAPVAKAFNNFVGLSGPCVCENGGIVYDGTFRRKKILFDRRHADRAVRFLARKGLPVRYIWSDPWRLSEVALDLNLDEAAVKEALRGWRLNVVSTKFAIHITEPGLNKFEGLKAALPFLPLKPRVKTSEVLAIGDSNNDVEILEGCGIGAAVANATPSAKGVSEFVAKKNYGDGVAEILRRYDVIP